MMDKKKRRNKRRENIRQLNYFNKNMRFENGDNRLFDI